MSKNHFCVRLKNKRKHNQHFKLLFFKLNRTLARQPKDLRVRN